MFYIRTKEAKRDSVFKENGISKYCQRKTIHKTILTIQTHTIPRRETEPLIHISTIKRHIHSGDCKVSLQIFTTKEIGTIRFVSFFFLPRLNKRIKGDEGKKGFFSHLLPFIFIVHIFVDPRTNSSFI